ncbi:Uma2 family endonuclease [Microcoleus sp. FACHB-831]|uniref:Uma2 family endonuclease n=1 Tax=Microcoleus sp. FACHB-831 TaxID=2692827 RepID=UPI0016853D8F|nr:Uma2 family endonuclease [Microcoleus sp. FACHB-831]MBD1924329.1 Uma2 family endonuclease [Microcoleus sp. FACHB-831]
MQTQTQQRYYTPEEYLELEEAAEYKNEYRDGEIVPMTGASINHNRIVRNFARILDVALQGHPYEVFLNDLRLWIPRYRLYFYPDVMVIEGEPVFDGTRTDTITNPRAIASVLSKSTKNYDRAEKFEYYRSLPEFREYILIDQYKFHIEHFAKTADGKWLLTDYESSDAVLALASLELEIPLSEIYERVNFDISEE